MPYNRPGLMAYVTRLQADKALNHGDPVIKDDLIGIAVKQKATPWSAGYTGLRAIGDGEDYAIITKGIVQVPDTRDSTDNDLDYNISALGKGDAVYITANGALTAVGTSNRAFGRIVETDADGRGVPANHVRIDLDKKDSV